MKKTTIVLTLLLAAGAPAAGFGISGSDIAAVEIPAAPAPSASREALAAEYEELRAALRRYSDIAFDSEEGTPGQLEAAAAGRYLRARLESVEAALGGPPSAAELAARTSADKAAAPRPWSVGEELDAFFGSDKRAAGATVPIKAGYCQIKYVKGNTPFLVQQDGFLKKGEVILTFDDGPGPLTEELAAALKNGGAPSLFFVLGSKLGAGGKAVIKNAAGAGHEAAVHGYWHATRDGRPFTALAEQETLAQLRGVKDSIGAATGRAPRFFRPPYGIIPPGTLKKIDSELGLIPLGWTIDTLDWSTKNPDELFNRTIALIQRRGKGIVLMHDIHPQSRAAAVRLVKWLAGNGYTVVSPDRLAQAYAGKETVQ